MPGAPESETSDGTTLIEIVRALETRGYTAQMVPRPGGLVRCSQCHTERPAHEFGLESLCRTEGASDPDDMAAVVALVCPTCGAHGTAALHYGPEASPEEADVLRLLDDRR